MTTRRLGFVVLLLYGVALIAPTVALPTIQLWGPPRGVPAAGGAETVRGFMALLMGVSIGPATFTDSQSGAALRGGLMILSSVSNVALLVGIRRLMSGTARVLQPSSGRLEGVLWGCALLNTHWIVYTGSAYPTRADVRLGYFLWLACFAFTATGLHALGRVRHREAAAALAG